MTSSANGTVTLLLCGDVMLGRGIDQVLAHPGDPTLREPSIRDARGYVELAEAVSAPIPRPVDDSWPWGDALAELTSAGAVRILNLETSITQAGGFAPRKSVHYRMNPANIGCLLAARPDVCVLANNHVLDFGRDGLADTLAALAPHGLATAGAGSDVAQAFAAARTPVGDAEVAVLACGHASSGIPRDWAASADRSGVALLPDLSEATAAGVGALVRQEKERGSIVVVSVHWGSNWGLDIPREQRHFAHLLVDAGADIVHGHSSHHPRPVEVYAGRLITYGCGDFINDYEGIGGHEEFRGDLRLLYRVSVDPTGALVAAELLPFRSHQLQLRRTGPLDTGWLATLLDESSRDFGVRARRTPEGVIELSWT